MRISRLGSSSEGFRGWSRRNCPCLSRAPELILPPAADNRPPVSLPEKLPLPESADQEPPEHASESPQPLTPLPDRGAAEVHLRAARNSVALGDIPEALARFDDYLRLAPDDRPARFEYVGLLMQSQRLPDAQRQLERLVAEEPGMVRYRMALADLLLRLKNYSAAREQFRILLSDPAYHLRASIMIARAFVLERRIAEAQKLYDQNLRDATNLSVEEKLSLALLLVDMDRPADAIRLLTVLHDAQPNDEGIVCALIKAYVRANRRLEALELIASIEEQPFKDVGLWLEVALELYNEQALAEASALLRHICLQDPTQTRAQLALARTQLRLYEVDAAKQILDSLEGDRGTHDFTTVLADYHSVVGEYSGSHRDC